MEAQELLALGFKDTSFVDDGIEFPEYTYELKTSFTIQISGRDLVEICDSVIWITVPSCNTIQDVKDLIRLFSLPL